METRVGVAYQALPSNQENQQISSSENLSSVFSGSFGGAITAAITSFVLTPENSWGTVAEYGVLGFGGGGVIGFIGQALINRKKEICAAGPLFRNFASAMVSSMFTYGIEIATESLGRTKLQAKVISCSVSGALSLGIGIYSCAKNRAGLFGHNNNTQPKKPPNSEPTNSIWFGLGRMST